MGSAIYPKTTRRYTHGTEQAKRKALEAARINVGEDDGSGMRLFRPNCKH